MLDGVLAHGRVPEAVGEAALLRAMLAAEAALARARGDDAMADAIAAAAGDPRLDPAELGRRAAESGNPVVPLVEVLRDRCGPDVHRGATSQDILDTAWMLVARDALAIVRDDLAGAADAAAALAGEHRATPIIGRTLMQQAMPTTFGLKAAGWTLALDTACADLDAVRPAAELAGPAGTLDGIGPDVLRRYCELLGLDEPVLPWHTDRTRIGGLAAALGVACGAIAKAAGDVVLLAQTEVGEVREGAPGRSSSMPHKRNPVAAISARACARGAPGLVANLLAAMEHEHERAAGAWHAEWAPLRALLVATGSAAAWLRACLSGLEVDAERMRANLPPDAAAPESAVALVDAALAGRGRRA
jgi:3-carboxy-cis,cis-muconate cycloisomerase